MQKANTIKSFVSLTQATLLCVKYDRGEVDARTRIIALHDNQCFHMNDYGRSEGDSDKWGEGQNETGFTFVI